MNAHAEPLALLLAAGAAMMTYLGGRLALRLGSRLPLLLGLTAGVVLGVALFDLLPEALGIGGGLFPARTVLAALAAGLVFYMILDRLLDTDASGAGWVRPHLGPASLTVHSFLDGMGIGLAFQVSEGVGIVIAVAVLAHDFSDGINTVGLTLANDRRDIAHRWLIADAAAPIVGVLVGSVIRLNNGALSLLLAGFAGAFLYIGACELIPRSYASGRHAWATLATGFGMVFMYSVIHFAQV